MLILFRFKLTVNNQECYPIFKKETFFDTSTSNRNSHAELKNDFF